MKTLLQPPSPHPTPALWDTPVDWRSDPVATCAHWLKSLGYSDASVRVYASMWSKFVRWIGTAGKRLEHCSPAEITDFFKDPGAFPVATKRGEATPEPDAIESLRLNTEQRRRYVRLIEQVFVHLQAIGVVDHNPGRQARVMGLSGGRNSRTRFLGHGEREALIARLRASASPIADEDGAGWTHVRDAAAVALILGGGLKVAEAVDLRPEQVRNPGRGATSIEIPRHGKVPEHVAPLLPFAEQPIADWLALRATIHPVSSCVLTPDLEKRNRRQPNEHGRMHPSTLFRRVSAFLATAGIEGDRSCAQTLRNTYAGSLIENGCDDQALAEALGIKQLDSVIQLRTAYRAWQAGAGEAMQEEACADVQ